MMRTACTLFFFLLLLPLSNSQCYSVDFASDQSSLVTNDCGDLCDCYLSYPEMIGIVEVSSGSILIIDTEGSSCSGTNDGGANDNTYETVDIDISGKCGVYFEATYSFFNPSIFTGAPNLECGCNCDGEDYLNFQYSIDGGAYQEFDAAQINVICTNDTGGPHVLTSTGYVSGNTVSFLVTFGAQSVTEGISVDGIDIFESVAPTISDPMITGCGSELENYDLTSENGNVGTGTVTWWNGQASSGGSEITPATDVDISSTGITNLWVQLEDPDTGCTSEIMVTVTEGAGPTIMDPMIEACANELMNIDLTDYDFSVGTGTVTWWDGQPSSGGTEITPATDVDISSGSGVDLWVQLEDPATGCTSEIAVTIDENPSPTITDPMIEGCADELMNYDLTTEDGNVGTGTVTWWDGQPSMGGTEITPATDVDISSGGITDLWVQLEDPATGCTSEIAVTVTENPNPPIMDPMIEACEDELMNYDLTTEDINVGTGTVTWWDGQASMGGTEITPATDVDISSGGITDLWVQLEDPATGCTSEIAVSVTENPSPSISDPMIEACENELLNYDLTSEDINVGTGTVSWWDGQPSMGGTEITPATDVDISSGGGTDLWVQLEDPATGCTSEIMVTVTESPSPTIMDPMIIDCLTNLEDYDLTDENANVGTGNVSWWDGQPSMGGTEITPATNVDISSGGITDLWVQLEDPATGCTAEIMVTVTETGVPTGCVSGAADICEGGCGDFTFSISGGSGDYTAGVSFTFLGLPFGPFDIPLSDIDNTFTLCFDPDLTLPNFDTGTNTVNLPVCDPLGFICLGEGDVITLTLETLVDNTTGCAGVVDPMPCTQIITFHAAPTANQVVFNFCADEMAMNYDITMHDLDVNPDGETVDWFDGDPDFGGTSLGTPIDLTDPDLELWAKVTSSFGCCNTEQMIIDLIEVPTVIIEGGGELCPFDCTSTSSTASDFTFTVMGGVGVYDITFDANGSSFIYNNVGMGESSFQICFDDLGGTPFIIDNGVVPPSITFDIGSGIIENIIQTTGINDNGTGCDGFILDPDFAKYDLLDTATYVLLDDQFACQDPGGSACFDLNALLSDLNPTPAGSTLNWYEGDDCDIPILDPSNYCITEDTEVCYTVVSSITGCETRPASVLLQFEAAPIFDVPAFVEYCGSDFTLPDITGTNLTGNELYFEGMGGTGSAYSPGDNYSPSFNPTTLYIFDPSAPNCSDEVSFELCVAEQPLIWEPTGEITACGDYTLPELDIVNDTENTGGYYSGPGGTGDSYNEGDIIDSDITLYVYVDNGCGCIAEEELSITITDEIVFEVPEIEDGCGFIKLPEITNNTGSAFFSSLNDDLSDPFWEPCDTIFATDGIDVLYIFDPFDTGCVANNGLEIPISIQPSPIILPIDDEVVCDSFLLSTISGIDLTGGEAYFTSADGSGAMFNVGDWISSDIVLYAYDNNGTCFTEESFSITIETSQNAGEGDTIRICEGLNDAIDLTDYISGNDNGGLWSENTGGVLDVSDPSMVDMSGLTGPGTYSVSYGFVSAVCGDVSTDVVIEVVQSPFVNVDPLIQVCNSSDIDFDLGSLVSGSSGIYFDSTWVELNNPEIFGISGTMNPSVNFSGAVPGIYEYVFNISSTLGANCPSAEDTVRFNVIEQLEAGNDETISSCGDDIFDLTNFVDNYDPANTNFTDLSGSGGLSGTLFNTSTLDPGSYDVEYIIMGIGDCAPDTALVTITITDVLDAGPGNIITVCEGEVVDLNGTLNGGDLGGSFTDAGGNLVTSPFTAMTDITLTYTVGGGSCPEDMAEITILVTPPPTIDILDPAGPLCDQECMDYVFQFGGSTLYTFDLIISNSSGVVSAEMITSTDMYVLTVCNTEAGISLSNDTLYVDNGQMDTWTLSVQNYVNAENCAATVTISDLVFESIPSLGSNYVDELCPGESVMINGTLYDENNMSGQEIFSVNGCDSIVDISLQFFEPAILDTIVNVCEGQTVSLGGNTITENDPSTGSFLLEGLSANACDSTINYTINFTSSIPVDITGPLCEDQSVIVNGNTYDFDNPNGVEMIAGLNGDCDTTVTIDLSFHPNEPGMFISDFCTGDDPIQIGDQFFDENTPDGMVTLSSQFGCDSTVTVSLNILQSIMEPYGIMEICPGDTIDIDGELFYEGKLQGQVNYPGIASNGCDSIVLVDLAVIQVSEGVLNETICPGGSIEINGVVFDETMLSGQISIEGATNEGCDSLVNVSISVLDPGMGTYIDTLCNGQSVIINGTTYDEANTSGTEILSGMASNGCDSIVDISLVFQLDFVFEPQAPCPGSEEGSLLIESGFGFDYPIEIIEEGTVTGTINSLPFFYTSVTGSHTISLLDPNGCSYEINYDIPQATDVNFDINSTQSSANGFDLSIDSEIDDFTSINWEPSDLSSCQDCESASFDIEQTETIYVTATYGDGCTLMDSVTLNFQKVVIVYIPNIFDPNLNSDNGSFFVQTDDDNDRVRYLRIFDRWGELVFEALDSPVNVASEGWDGTYNSQPVVQGVYVYSLEVEFSDGQVQQHIGDVTLVR